MVEKKARAGLAYLYKADMLELESSWELTGKCRFLRPEHPRFSFRVVRRGSKTLYFEQAVQEALAWEACGLCCALV